LQDLASLDSPAAPVGRQTRELPWRQTGYVCSVRGAGRTESTAPVVMLPSRQGDRSQLAR
jgi:hypothetical protein